MVVTVLSFSSVWYVVITLDFSSDGCSQFILILIMCMLLPKNNNILDGLAVATTVCIGDSALFFYKKKDQRENVVILVRQVDGIWWYIVLIIMMIVEKEQRQQQVKWQNEWCPHFLTAYFSACSLVWRDIAFPTTFHHLCGKEKETFSMTKWRRAYIVALFGVVSYLSFSVCVE